MKFCVALLFIANICSGQRTILWEVIDTKSGNQSFIVGTFHNLGNSFVDSIPVLAATLKRSEIAIFESIDDVSKLRETLQKRNKQKTINRLLSREDLIKLNELSKDWKVSYEFLKPIELLITLRKEFQLLKCKTVKPTDQWDHFDNYLIDLAKQHNINLVGLETDSIQLNLLNHIEKSWSKKAVAQEIRFWISRLTTEENWYEECNETQNYIDFEIDYELISKKLKIMN